MVVDDSAVIRGMITRILQTSPDIEVIASAHNGEMAISSYDRNPADVIILDVEMPVMDGITALGHIMKKHPKAKVIMCSTLTHSNAEITLRAMALGAADYIAKPTSTSEINSSGDFQQNLIRLVTNFKPRFARTKSSDAAKPSDTVSAKKPNTTQTPLTLSALKANTPNPVLRPEPPATWQPRVLAVSSSTGGPQALFNFFKALDGVSRTPIVVTQHMPPTFTALLAKHITMHTGVPAVEAEDKMPLLAGRIHVAHGGMHMLVEKTPEGTYVLRLNDGPPENFCKPAADPMLRSLIPIYGNQILSVVLTGMGSDGTKGCADIIKAGGYVAAQDQASSVVWGMPGSVAVNGLACKLDTPEALGAWTRTKVM